MIEGPVRSNRPCRPEIAEEFALDLSFAVEGGGDAFDGEANLDLVAIGAGAARGVELGCKLDSPWRGLAMTARPERRVQSALIRQVGRHGVRGGGPQEFERPI